MGIIKQLYQETAVGLTDETKTKVYPITALGAVYSPSGSSLFPNRSLDQILTSLMGGYQYVGKATTATTPGSYDHPVFYLASEAESTAYPNFGSGVTVSGLTVIKYNGSTWETDVFDIAASGGGGGGGGTTNLFIGTTQTQSTSQAQNLRGISNLFLETGGKIYFGSTDAAPYIEYNAVNAAFHFSKAIYSDEQVAAGGIGTGGGGGGGGSTVVWGNSSNNTATLTVDSTTKTVLLSGWTELPTVTSSDNGLVLKVVNGAWTKASESAGGTTVSWGTESQTAHTVQLTVNGTTKTVCLNGYSAGGGVSTESDPVFTSSAAYNIQATDITTWNGKQNQVELTGSSTIIPVYVSSAGNFALCTKYAGGTKVTLNGTAKGGSTATFYAPTGAGTSGQYLVSSGSGAPAWTPVADSIVNGGTALTPSGVVYSYITSTIGNYVTLNTDQNNISGQKTFSKAILGSGTPNIGSDSGPWGDLYLKSNGAVVITSSGAHKSILQANSYSSGYVMLGYGTRSTHGINLYGSGLSFYNGSDVNICSVNNNEMYSPQEINLGLVSHPWNDLFAKTWRPTTSQTSGFPKMTYTNNHWEITGDLVVTGYVTAGGTNSDNNTTLSGNLLPATSGLNIGAFDNKINNIFATQLGNNTSGGKITNIYVNHSYVDDAHIAVANISGTLSVPTITLTTAQSSTFEAELEHESGYTSSAINAYIGGTTLSDIIIGDVWVIKSTNYTLRVTGWRKNGTLYELYMGKFTFIQQSGGSNWKIYKTA